MRIGQTTILAAALAIAGPVAAQDYDASYGGYDDYGYGAPLPDERGYGTRPPPPGSARPMPGYRDNGQWRSSETWSSTDARDIDARGAETPDYPVAPPVPPKAAAKGDAQAYRNAQADYRARLDDWNRQYGSGAESAADPRYRERVARWRARADACEGGDRSACEGPD